MRIIMATLGVCLSLMIHAADQKAPRAADIKQVTVVTIPDHNGAGSDEAAIRRMLGNNSVKVIPVEKKVWDFGQSRSQKYLAETLQHQAPCIVYAEGFQTPTPLNLLANKPNLPVNALILNRAIASGNSVINHVCCKGYDEVPAYYITPYTTKLLGLLPYWPSGPQAIDSAEKLFTDIPIIIGQATRNREAPDGEIPDARVPDGDARALYYCLKDRGHSVYLIRTQHGILDDSKSHAALQAILQKHGLMHTSKEQKLVDLSPYQPDHEMAPFQGDYDDIREREDCHKRIGRVLKALGAAAAIWGLHTLNRIICWQCVQGR